MAFQLIAPYTPQGDQPKAIQQLVAHLKNGIKHQTLLGVTGSGKTFTIANTIQKTQKPTLVLSHNKTLAAQLYTELKQFFPHNLIEYFVSYYDYYQPEAYIPSSNIYIEKDLSINEEIEKMRLSAIASLLTGRRDVIVVASVSCIYGIGNPREFGKNILHIKKGETFIYHKFLLTLVNMLYSRSQKEFKRGNFRVKGDTVDVFLAYADYGYRFLFFGDIIEEIHSINPKTGKKINIEKTVTIFPANLFVVGKEVLMHAIQNIQNELVMQIDNFKKNNLSTEAQRIQERTELDMEMMRELGYCSGIENYSRYLDGRKDGERPFCLLDYFPNDYLMIIDESHVSIPQIGAMFGGDHSRKSNLVTYGFRLPSALDNRPLKFNEFELLTQQVIYVSATPSAYELQKSEGIVVEQIIRPTGLLDPEVTVRPSTNQLDDLLHTMQQRIQKKERVLITTLTKRMAEELSFYLKNIGVRCQYIHSEIKTLERIQILQTLRLGKFDVLIGVNLLREGIDLPEVSLVAILDADKEGFLRNVKSLVQTIGRAARNKNGFVIMYADRITKSMKIAIEETKRRRNIQMDYNKQKGIIPQTIKSAIVPVQKSYYDDIDNTIHTSSNNMVAEDNIIYGDNLSVKDIDSIRKKMNEASKNLNFLEAARLRDLLLKKKKDQLKN